MIKPWNEIKQEINTNIADNNQQLITAEKVRTTLIDIVSETENEDSEIILNIDTLYDNINRLDDKFGDYYTKTEIDDNLGDVHQYVDDEIDTLHNITWAELMQQVTICKNYTNSYCNSNYYDKTQSNQLYKPTGVFFYFGDRGENECNCKVSYVNFINEDGPEGDFYLIEGAAIYGLDNSFLFNISTPYGSMYSCTYSMRLYDVATEAFTRALGPGHTPQIHTFDKAINLTIAHPSTVYTNNRIIMVANVSCNDEYDGDVTFSLVSAYEQTNLPMVINVGFRCWVQDVQQ